MESRSTIVRYFSLVSLLSISCISFAGGESSESKSNNLEPQVMKAAALGVFTGSVGTMAINNRVMLKERSADLLAYLKSFRSASTIVAPEIASVVTETTQAAPSFFAGITASASAYAASAQSGISSGLNSAWNGLGSAKDIVVSGIGSVGNGLVSAKNTASAFGSKSIETIGGYAHAALTGSRDCGKAVFEAVTNNPKTSGAVVAGVAGVALAVYYRKALAKKIGQAYAGTKNLLATNAYIGALAAGGTLLAGKALLQSDFLARNSATASAYFNKV